jgi:hypothetical protein
MPPTNPQDMMLEEMKKEIPTSENQAVKPNPDQINKNQAEIASLQKQLAETNANIKRIEMWMLAIDPMSGEYRSFTEVMADTCTKFRKVYSVEKTSDQKNIDYVGNYWTDLLEKSESAPTPYGEAIKDPEKHHDETSKEMQQKWRKI